VTLIKYQQLSSTWVHDDVDVASLFGNCLCLSILRHLTSSHMRVYVRVLCCVAFSGLAEQSWLVLSPRLMRSMHCWFVLVLMTFRSEVSLVGLLVWSTAVRVKMCHNSALDGPINVILGLTSGRLSNQKAYPLSYIIDRQKISFEKKTQNCDNSVVCHISTLNQGISGDGRMFGF